jgi:hypothetical protein
MYEAHLWPALMSTHVLFSGAVGYASAATMVTGWSSKHTVWYTRVPALMIRYSVVWPGVTVVV